jgi:Metallo-peptidase family M12B Reprolysin-like/PEP-CTERM motif
MRLKPLCAILALIAAPFAQAAYVSLPEAAMDAIFSQANFGNTPIDIRFGPETQMARPDLLNIANDSQIGTLFGLHQGSQTDVNFFFVDTIDSCGVINVNFIGCGETPGQDFVVESAFAASSQGALLLAHELGHNLGLDHLNGSQFLMNPSLDGGDLLTVAEVATILGSPLVKMDTSGQRFILINPVLIVERIQDVPEPSVAALLLIGLSAAGLSRHNRRATG